MKTNTAKTIGNLIKAVPISLCFLASLPSGAQTIIEYAGNIYPIFKEYTSDGRPQFYFEESNDECRNVKVYNSDLSLCHEFSSQYDEAPFKTIIEERSPVGAKSQIAAPFQEEVTSEYVYKFDEGYDISLEEAREEAFKHGCTKETVNGDTYTFLPEELPENDVYTKYVYVKDSYFAEYLIFRHEAYSEWKAVEEKSGINLIRSRDYGFEFRNFDISASDDQSFLFYSQTLFNNDENYEYIVSEYELRPTPFIKETDWHTYDNGKRIAIRRELRYSDKYCKTSKVLSENGTTVATFEGEAIHILVFGGKSYLVTISREDDSKSDYIFYEIDREQASLREVKTISANVFPSLVHRSEFVTVETGEELVDTPREVTVTSMDGRVIERTSIPAGERNIQIGTSRMTSGIYNLTIFANGQRIENCKIIVK